MNILRTPNSLGASYHTSLDKLSSRSIGAGAVTGAAIGALGDSLFSSDLVTGQAETSETLVSKDLQARFRNIADELKVRKWDQDATQAQQADVALEVSGKALTGLEGAVLTFAVRGQKGKAELVSEDGSRLLQLPVEPRSQSADLGYIVGLPDGSKLSVATESPWNPKAMCLERTSQEGATLRANFTSGIDGQATQLTALVASSNDGKHYIGLHDDNGQDQRLMLTVGSNDFSSPDTVTSRGATELGLSPVFHRQMGMMGAFGSVGQESSPLTAAVLRDAAQQVGTQNPLLG